MGHHWQKNEPENRQGRFGQVSLLIAADFSAKRGSEMAQVDREMGVRHDITRRIKAGQPFHRLAAVLRRGSRR